MAKSIIIAVLISMSIDDPYQPAKGSTRTDIEEGGRNRQEIHTSPVNPLTTNSVFPLIN